MGSGGSKCPNPLPSEPNVPGSRVTFRPPLLTPDSSPNANQFVYRAASCGNRGINGAGCFRPIAQECFNSSGCYCLANGDDSNVGRIELPGGTKMEVFTNSTCEGNPVRTVNAFSDQFEIVTGTQQSFRFTTLPNFGCNKNNFLQSTRDPDFEPGQPHQHEARDPAEAQHRKVLIALIALLGVLALMILSSAPERPPPLSNKQILSSVGLTKGGVPNANSADAIRKILAKG